MMEFQNKLTEAKKAEIKVSEDKLKSLVDEEAAMRRLEKLRNSEQIDVKDLSIVWDEHTNSFLYAAEQRAKALEYEVSLIEQLRGVKSGAYVPSNDPGGDINRYAGGPVTANNPYIVGEKGPELFVPNNNGQIVPNNQLTSGDSTELYLNFNSKRVGPLGTTKQIAREVLKEFEIMKGALS